MTSWRACLIKHFYRILQLRLYRYGTVPARVYKYNLPVSTGYVPGTDSSKRLASDHHLPFPPFASSLIGGDASREEETSRPNSRDTISTVETSLYY
jgi:hypothetical protein